MSKRKNFKDIPKIQKTTDYSIFKFHKSNRPTENAHIKRIMREIKENPNTLKFSPVLIDNKGNIIDGQHTLIACIKLDMPVFYIQSDELSIKFTPKFNRNQKRWSLQNFIHFFSTEEKKKDYVKTQKLRKKYPISYGVLTALLMMGRNYRAMKGGIREVSNAVKNGDYSVNFEKFFVDFADTLLKIKKSYNKDFVFKRSFVNAFYDLYTHPEYSKKEFFENLDKNSHKLIDLPDADSHRVELQKLVDNKKINLMK